MPGNVKPLVSVLMSTFNDAKFISQAIEGVLNQTYKNFELLITIDGSSDNTEEIVSRYRDPRICVNSRENRGKAFSMNEMIQNARGDFVMIHDSDDVSAPNRIEVLVREFEQSPDIALVQSGYALIIDGKVVAPKGRDLSQEQCARKIAAYKLPELDPTAMIKTDIAKDTLFNPELKIGEGIDFIYRIAERYPMKVVGQPLYWYRYNTASITKKNQEKKVRYLTEVMNMARQRRGDMPVSYETILAQQGTGRKAADNNLSGHFTESVYTLIESGQRLRALVVACYSLRFLGSGLRFGKPLLYAITPLWLGRIGRAILGQNRR